MSREGRNGDGLAGRGGVVRIIGIEFVQGYVVSPIHRSGGRPVGGVVSVKYVIPVGQGFEYADLVVRRKRCVTSVHIGT